MFDIILACVINNENCDCVENKTCNNEKYGIGYENKIPWYIPEDLKYFKEKTLNNVLIMGRKTVECLPYLKNRIIICVTRKEENVDYENDVIYVNSIESAIELAEINFSDKKIFIAGGAEIYNYCFSKLLKYIDTLHMTIIKKNVRCDTFLTKLKISDWSMIENKNYEMFDIMTLKYTPYGEQQYLNLLTDIYNNGIIKSGRNGKTYSKFIHHLQFNLREGFPLLTTKKMFINGIIEELLFFLRGDTNTKILEEKGVNIWKGNTNREFLDQNGFNDRKDGIMGPMYGYQWRFFNAEYDEKTGKAVESLLSKGVDQLKNLIDNIKTDPNSRRHLLTDYNPSQASQGVLYPCHSIINQFYVEDNFLDMFCYIRSSDTILGLPFNIAMCAVFQTIIAKLCKKEARMLYITLGDAHIYEEHIHVIEDQIYRQPFTSPTLRIEKELIDIKDIESLTLKDFVINNYRFHPAIKVNMVS